MTQVQKEWSKKQLSKWYERSLDVAKWLHNQYMAHAIIADWKVQKNTLTDFEDLPKENKQVMMWLAQDVVNLIKEDRASVIKEVVEKIGGYRFSYLYPHSTLELKSTSDVIEEHNKLINKIFDDLKSHLEEK